MHRLDTSGVFLSDSGGWRMTLWNFNFRPKMSWMTTFLRQNVFEMMNFVGQDLRHERLSGLSIFAIDEKLHESPRRKKG